MVLLFWKCIVNLLKLIICFEVVGWFGKIIVVLGLNILIFFIFVLGFYEIY